MDPRVPSAESAAALIEELTEERADPALVNDPVISIACQTFNHEGYLREAIESVLAQDVAFDFEILLGDDCSTDSTFEIAEDLFRKHPTRIRLLRSRQNLCAIAGTPRLNTLRNFWRARGRYIAFLEGDDFWVDPGKLQRQVDYLEMHQGAAGCFTDCQIVDEDGREIVPRPFWRKGYRKSYTQLECLRDFGSAYGSATLVFRRSVISKGLPCSFLEIGSDFLLDLAITEHGTLDYIAGETAAYRIHSGGIWQGNARSANLKIMLKRLGALSRDKHFVRRYRNELDVRWQSALTKYWTALGNEGVPVPNRIQRVIADSGLRLHQLIRVFCPRGSRVGRWLKRLGQPKGGASAVGRGAVDGDG